MSRSVHDSEFASEGATLRGRLYLPSGDGPLPAVATISPDDEMPGADTAVARGVFESIAGPTTTLASAGGHFGIIFDPSPELDWARDVQARFLLEHL